MKKNYSTPLLMFDSFELSENIATNCTAISNHDYGECAAVVKDILDESVVMVVFQFTPQCEVISPNPDLEDKVCYHVPYDQNKVFTS